MIGNTLNCGGMVVVVTSTKERFWVVILCFRGNNFFVVVRDV